jgi:predicted nucleic acid-binding protein
VSRPRAKKSLRAPLVADTGGLLHALACDDRGRPTWPAFAQALEEATAVLVPDLVLAEVDCFLRSEREAMRTLVADILDPASTYELVMADPVDLVRALHIDARFQSLQLGLVDSLVCAVAERRDTMRVLTTDVRDFSVVRIGARHDRALTLVP